MNKSAIVGYGFYVPKHRITVEEIALAHHQDASHIRQGLGVQQKSVPDIGEDTFTMAFEAGKQAIETAGIESSQISAVFVGSESHPYAVKPTSGMVAAALDVHPFCHAADLEFACKAGTAGLQIVDCMVRAGQIEFGLAIGSDTAQSAPGDALEYTAAAGAAAFIVGPATHKHAFATMDSTLSFTTDTPDFWRANDSKYPAHAGRFTGEPGYFHHMRETIKGILEVTKMNISDFAQIILHMPNAKFPSRVAKEFGMTKEQMQHGFIVPEIGNTYSACSLLGFAHAIQHAKKDEKILLVSYGSGAGCDAFVMTMLRDGKMLHASNTSNEYLTYSDYLAHSSSHA